MLHIYMYTVNFSTEFCSYSMNATATADRKIVCVIGAGAAGLCAARNCALDPYVAAVTVFEQGGRPGGTWNYEPDTQTARIKSSMYESLVTNLPKEVMAFREFPFDGFSDDSFVKREIVLQYLEAYSRPIADYIQFNSRVISVEPMADELYLKEECHTPSIKPLAERRPVAKPIKWRVTVERDGRYSVNYFDCVFVCNGHLSTPKYPDIAKVYKKQAIHSHYYRKPEAFDGMKVAVIGAGPSGCDISAQLVGHAKEIVLLHKETVPAAPPFGRLRNVGVRTVALVGADSDALLLAGGERVDDIDRVIYCTGYDYSFPFLRHVVVSSNEWNNAKCGPIADVNTFVGSGPVLLWLDVSGRVIRPLFAHLAHVDYADSLFFIGLPFVTVPFVLFEQQVHFAIGLMTGLLLADRILSEANIVEFEAQQFRALEKANQPSSLFHRLGSQQWEHYDWLWRCYAASSSSRGATALTARLRRLRVPPVVRAIYEHCETQRRRDVEKYHQIRYQILSDTEFRAIYPTSYSMSDE